MKQMDVCLQKGVMPHQFLHTKSLMTYKHQMGKQQQDSTFISLEKQTSYSRMILTKVAKKSAEDLST